MSLSEQSEIPFPRSERLADPVRCGLLVVDLQPRILAAIDAAETTIWNATRLIRGAQLFEIGCRATVQYPRGLGPQDERVEALTGNPIEKVTFSAGVAPEVADWVRETGLEQIVISGIETHVCVAQSALDLLAAGLDVFIAADAVSARNDLDHETALRRLSDEGATISTTEGILFEWCGTSAAPSFKQLSGLVRESGPSRPA